MELDEDGCLVDAFISIIWPGANRDGYWNLDMFVLQFENFMDACAVMFPGIQHLVSLDNSANHRGKRPGGLDVTKMNLGYGGAQNKMDQTVIPDDLEGNMFENNGRRLKP
eukprot:scaffold15483_cov213-Cylindrotheca_fusiformis.AAC.1